MAAVQKRNGSYRVIFRYRGKQHAFTMGEVSEQEAATKASQVNYLLMRLRQRLLVLPPGVDIVSFVEHDGKGVDQRLVQEWCGHMNEATSRRYRHLWPSTQAEAIKSVFP
jgi:hypothetical protein